MVKTVKGALSMWTFRGKYLGAAKNFLLERKKKRFKLFSILFSIAIIIIFTIMAITLSDGKIDDKSVVIICCVGAIAGILFCNIVLFIDYKRELKCDIQILNDGFYIDNGDGQVSFAFYKVAQLDYAENFIVVNKMYVLQKELLVEGDWEELKILLKKVQDSLDTEEPMYQIEESESLFYTATVKRKRIYQKFVTGVSTVVPVSQYQYFVLFDLEGNGEIEYEVGQEVFENIKEEQEGVLVVVNNNFFSFGEAV